MKRKIFVMAWCVVGLIGCGAKKNPIIYTDTDELKPKFVVINGDSVDINEGVVYGKNHHAVDDGYMFYYYLMKHEDGKLLWKAKYSHTTSWKKQGSFLSEETVSYKNYHGGTEYSLEFYEEERCSKKWMYADSTIDSVDYLPSDFDIKEKYDEELSHLRDSIKFVDWEWLIDEHRPKEYRLK